MTKDGFLITITKGDFVKKVVTQSERDTDNWIEDTLISMYNVSKKDGGFDCFQGKFFSKKLYKTYGSFTDLIWKLKRIDLDDATNDFESSDLYIDLWDEDLARDVQNIDIKVEDISLCIFNYV